MRKYMIKIAKSLRRNEDGVTLVEYGIAVTLAVSVGIVLFTQLANDVNNQAGSASAILT